MAVASCARVGPAADSGSSAQVQGTESQPVSMVDVYDLLLGRAQDGCLPPYSPDDPSAFHCLLRPKTCLDP